MIIPPMAIISSQFVLTIAVIYTETSLKIPFMKIRIYFQSNI